MSNKSGNELKFIKKLVLIIIGLCAFLFSANKMIQVISSFLLILYFVSWIYSKILYKNIEIKRTVKEFRINRTDFFTVTIEICNNSFLPLIYSEVYDTPSPLQTFGEGARFCVSLGAKRKTFLNYNISGSSRGEFFIGPLVLLTSDPLGFFKIKIEYEEKCRVLVIPAKRDIDCLIKDGIPQGEIIVKDKRYEDLSLYRSIREYQSGDEFKRINWKVCARLGKLFTNEYQDSLNSPFFIYLDLNLNDYPNQFRYKVIEHAIEITAALLLHSKKLKQENGFATNGIIKCNNKEIDGVQPYFPIRANQTELLLDITALLQPIESKDYSSTDNLKKSLWNLNSNTNFYYVGFKKINPEVQSLLMSFEKKLNIKYFLCEELS
mgnify:CR=1 FL=1